MVATFETPHTETLLPGKLSRGSQAEALANGHGLDPPMRALSLHREGVGVVATFVTPPPQPFHYLLWICASKYEHQ